MLEDFTLGEWLVQPQLCRLSSGDRTVRVRARVMDVLAYLAARPGEVVSKDRLLQDVWGTEAITESALTRTIAELRQALGDHAAEPRLLETIQKRGYRLIGPVGRRLGTTPPPRAEHVTGPRCWLILRDRETPLAVGEHVLGRDPGASLHVDLISASRRHAKFVVTETGATIEDLGSKNGTWVRGVRVTGPVPLEDGDEIGIGGMHAIFRCLRGPAPTRTAGPP